MFEHRSETVALRALNAPALCSSRISIISSSLKRFRYMSVLLRTDSTLLRGSFWGAGQRQYGCSVSLLDPKDCYVAIARLFYHPRRRGLVFALAIALLALMPRDCTGGVSLSTSIGEVMGGLIIFSSET